MKYFITLFLYFFLPQLSAISAVKDFSATYDLYHNEIFIGKSTRNLLTENQLLTFSSISTTGGVASWFFDITITEISKLQLKNKNLKFISYRYNEKNNGTSESYQILRKKHKKLYNSHTKEFYSTTDNVHDTLGFTLAIMFDLQAGKREIKYTIAKKNSFKAYTLKFIKKEYLTTKTGGISTLKMEYYDPSTKLRFTLWCSENMGFLPIRIRKINHKGDENLLNLTHFNQKAISLTLDIEETEETN